MEIRSQRGKEAPSALAGCSELTLRGYRRLVWKSLQAWMYRARWMGSADLKHQVPCQKIGVGQLPTSRPSRELGIPGRAGMGKG